MSKINIYQAEIIKITQILPNDKVIYIDELFACTQADFIEENLLQILKPMRKVSFNFPPLKQEQISTIKGGYFSRNCVRNSAQKC